ncbi:MAG: hypothetical protein H6993_12175 [Pseudomonadales bacterium]|nr:hypothetical protein [Pseudomonadales bacterium]
MTAESNRPLASRNGRRAGWWLAASLLACLVGAGAAMASADCAAYAACYDVVISPDLREVLVETRLPEGGKVRIPGGVRPDTISDCTGERMRMTAVDVRPPGGCLRIDASLVPSPLAAPGRRMDRFVSPDDWLPRPEVAGERHLRLRPPPGMDVFVPWRRIGEHAYRIPPSPRSGRTLIDFGSFATRQLVAGDATLTLWVLDATLDADRLAAWLLPAVHSVATVGGRFPSPHVQLVAQRGHDAGSPFDASPVPFGHVMRNGGEVVRFFVDPEATAQQLGADWTAAHELSHLLLPYVHDREKWISEGFASYYQNLLMARQGQYSALEMWQRLTRSFAAAGGIASSATPGNAYRHPFWDVRLLVYWSGAAMALMADVELRARAGGTQSLDSVLGALEACCLPSTRVWTGESLFAQLDALAGGAPVFMPLYHKVSDTPGMPDTSVLLRDLGVIGSGGDARLDDSAALADIRRSLTRVD